MATIACPGCGLPRAQSEADKPCPVCEAGIHDLPAGPRQAEAVRAPADGLPADVSRLHETSGEAPHGHRPEVVAGVVGIVIGAVLAVVVQSFLPSHSALVPPPPATASEPRRTVAAPPTGPNFDHPVTLPAGWELAPMPHEAPPAGAVVSPPAPPVLPKPAAPTEKMDVTLQIDQPEGAIAFPNGALAKAGNKTAIRGRVKTLTVYVPGDGMTIDASGLVAERINVYGKISGGSVIKLNCPKGAVHFSQTTVVENGSKVFVHAPEGEVMFDYRQNRITGGSRVEISAKTVKFNGEIAGKNTYVGVTIDKGGSIHVIGVRDKAILEYRKSHASDPAPNIDIPTGAIDPSAVVRRAN